MADLSYPRKVTLNATVAAPLSELVGDAHISGAHLGRRPGRTSLFFRASRICVY